MKKWYGYLGVLVLIVLATSAYKISSKSETEILGLRTEQKYSDATTGLSFSYSSQLSQGVLSQDDREDKFIARLSTFDPPAIISVRYEDGLRAISSITGADTLSLVTENAKRALPNRYPDFSLISEQSSIWGERDSSELTFAYLGPSGELATQRLVIVIKDDDTAVYFSFQSAADTFDDMSSQYFEPLLNTVVFER